MYLERMKGVRLWCVDEGDRGRERIGGAAREGDGEVVER